MIPVSISFYAHSSSRFAAVMALAAVLFASTAQAQSTPVMRRGDAAVTSFSGALKPAAPPPGVHPLDATMIDTRKPTLQVIDLSKLGGPPSAQLANAPVRFEAKAFEIGHVFAVTTYQPIAPAAPNIYAAATSLFGLQIVEPAADGTLKRLVKGSPRAQWMPGQFGLEKGGGPGSIWKIDGATGAISLFSTLTSGNAENGGPGLGGLAIDDLTGDMFASNLETGLIHRLDKTGRDLETFDHGVAARTSLNLPAVADDPSKRMDIKNPAFNIEDPATWGYANPKRRVIALAVSIGRLYYSVAEGPVIWSVGLNADSSFVDDARLEIDITHTPNNNPVTGIVFDGSNTMFISQRGEATGSYDYSTFARPQLSVVSRYTFDETKKEWAETPEEVAIGLEPVHRATNGGVALNYGYDADGNIDPGKCRQTLWTTGEHLRAGAGDGAAVHGLQGNDKGQVQVPSTSPARSGSTALQGDFSGMIPDAGLTPPKDVWFTDAVGTIGGAGAHAHIGAIAIHAPCDQVASAAPRPLPPPYVPPVPGAPKPPYSEPGIYIDKICAPAIFGAKTRCDISVTNFAMEPLWAVGFTDGGKILAGPGAGAPLTITAVTPDGPDFLCSAVPSPAVSCALPASVLLPGMTRTVSMLIDTDPVFGPGNSGYENCATLNLPHFGKTCVRVNEGASGGSLVLKKTGPAVCLANGACTYTLAVTNASLLPVAGPVVISDEMMVGGVASAAPIAAVVPAMGCAGGEPAVLPINCAAAFALAPGASKSFDVTFTMPPGNYWAHNCFAVSGPGGPPPGPLSAHGSCVWTKVGNPAPLANLKMSKTAGACAKTGPATVRCNFALSLTNTGPSPFNAPVTLAETVSATATLGSLDAAWLCAGAAPNFTCNSAANVVLASGASTSFDVFVDTPRVDIEANVCLAPNKVQITAPPVGATNFDGTDDSAVATADSALLEFFDPITGLTLVICDPTNLRTRKVATGDCTAAGSNYDCGYEITVTNMGPDPYQGPVNLKDETPGATSVSASGAGWSCAGAGALVHCSTAPLTLAKSDSLKLTVKATVPETGSCSTRNTATMTFPFAGTRWNLSGADDSSTASAGIPSPKCLERPTCSAPGPGEFATASGACACTEGSTRDKKLRCVRDDTPEPPPAANLCPDGYPIPQNGICPCPTGSVWNASTRACDAPCEPGPNEYRTSSGKCVCKTGYVRASAGGLCLADDGDGPDVSVPPVRPPAVDDGCDPGPNEVVTASGRCVCREGYERSNGRCVPERDEPSCTPGPNEVRTSRGRCVCREGYERNANGRCIAERNLADECRQAGRVWTGKRCIDPPNLAAECKSSGGRWVNGTCVYGPSAEEKCEARGGRYVEGDCVFPLKQCPEGTIGKYPECRKPTAPDPAAACNKRGGRYVNGKCIIGDPAPPKTCPPGMAGKPPVCIPLVKPKCPNGTTGNWPKCKPVKDTAPETKRECPKGTAGVFPNCKPKPSNDVEVPKTKDEPRTEQPNLQKFDGGQAKKLQDLIKKQQEKAR